MNTFIAVLLTTHIGLSADYNEIHPNVGMYLDEEKQVSVGAFLNSENNMSAYVGWNVEFSESISADIGLVSGYSQADITPMLRVNYNNFFVSPSIEIYDGETNPGIVFGIEWRFDNG
jgi:hypothetical protein